MYRVSTKNCAKIDAPSKSPPTFEPESVRRRKIRSGSSGAFERLSITKKLAMSATERVIRTIVSVVPQPCCAAWVIA